MPFDLFLPAEHFPGSADGGAVPYGRSRRCRCNSDCPGRVRCDFLFYFDASTAHLPCQRAPQAVSDFHADPRHQDCRSFHYPAVYCQHRHAADPVLCKPVRFLRLSRLLCRNALRVHCHCSYDRNRQCHVHLYGPELRGRTAGTGKTRLSDLLWDYCRICCFSVSDL